ncbi:MAG: DNA helicase RecQ [Pseudomonadota bacterium]
MFSSSLTAQALHVLQTVFGYPAFRGQQADIIELVASGNDALVLMPTGGGKSLCYQIPALLREGIGVVISPLIALMQDQVSALEEVGVRAAFLNSSQTAQASARIERQVRQGELDILYIAPERLMMPRCLELLESSRLALFAIDEAHCVSQWGHDFRPEYIQLSILHEKFPSVPRIALTATADPITHAEIAKRLKLENAQHFISSFDRPNISYHIVDKDNGRKQLFDFIKNEHLNESGIVYCLSRKKVEETAEFLSKQGLTALAYHAGMDNTQRAANQARFLREENIIMVATIAFGMGIDKPDVRFVAHLDMPKSIEGYYQETGRAGRDGNKATAWMVYGLQDVVQQRRLIDLSEADIAFKRVQTAKLDAMLGLCETLACRRVRLLEYFGQNASPCGNCDNCITPPQSFDGTVLVQKLLSAIYRVQQRFGAGHVIDMLKGVRSEKIQQWHHDQLSTFGIGVDQSEAEWRAILRQCIALGLVSIDHDAFSALKLTDRARSALRGENPIQLRHYQKPIKTKTRDKDKARKQFNESIDADFSVAEKNLFMELREWRRQVAYEHNVPAYVIFHDATLRELAKAQPTSLAELSNISGLGKRKLDSYGEDLIKLINEHIE